MVDPGAFVEGYQAGRRDAMAEYERDQDAITRRGLDYGFGYVEGYWSVVKSRFS